MAGAAFLGIGAGLLGASFCAGVLVAYYGFRCVWTLSCLRCLDRTDAVSDQPSPAASTCSGPTAGGSAPAGSLDCAMRRVALVAALGGGGGLQVALPPGPLARLAWRHLVNMNQWLTGRYKSPAAGPWRPL